MNTSPELIGIVVFGLAVVGFLWRLSRDMRALERDMRDMSDRFSNDLRALAERTARDSKELGERTARDSKELGERTARDSKELGERTARDSKELGERVARLEGLLEGLRDAITGRQPEAGD